MEINPKYNYQLLNLNQEFDKKDYDKNFKQLGPTLSVNDYDHLQLIMANLRKVNSVISVERAIK